MCPVELMWYFLPLYFLLIWVVLFSYGPRDWDRPKQPRVVSSYTFLSAISTAAVARIHNQALPLPAGTARRVVGSDERAVFSAPGVGLADAGGPAVVYNFWRLWEGAAARSRAICCAVCRTEWRAKEQRRESVIRQWPVLKCGRPCMYVCG